MPLDNNGSMPKLIMIKMYSLICFSSCSARLGLPATENGNVQNPIGVVLTLPPASKDVQQLSDVCNCDPVIEEPVTPEPEEIHQEEFDIEDFCKDPEEIPMIRLNMEAFTQNLQTYMENNMELAEGDMSRALVALTSEADSIHPPKLKNVSRLRTEHQV